MKNKVGLLLLLVISLILGTSNVSAKSFATFEKGDLVKITVKNDEVKNFYVLSDSSETDEYVIAISDDVLGDAFFNEVTSSDFALSTASAKLIELTSTWINPIEIKLPSVRDINSSYVVSKDLNEIFSTPNYFMGESYWLSDIAVDGEAFFPIVVSNWNTFSAVHTTTSSSPENSGKIRPVIKVSKNFVEGGIILSENEKSCYDFGIKVLENYFEEPGQEKVLVSGTELTLTCRSHMIKLTCENGVVSGDNSNLSVDKYIFNNYIYDGIFRGANPLFANEYDELEMMYNNTNISQEELNKIINRLEAMDKEFASYTFEKNNFEAKLEDDYYIVAFKYDFKNGFIPNQIQTVENPSTGLDSVFIKSIGVIVLFGGIYLLSKKITNFPKSI